ncbi:MAG: glutamine synthetase beta-grasp domain-containing protein [Candidatus Anstonellales archaeon]
MPAKDVLDRISSSGIKWLYLEFVDVLGYSHSVGVPSHGVSEEELERGVSRSDVGSVFNDHEELFLKPDLDTFAFIPWMDSASRMICNIYTQKEEFYLKDPRYILQRAVKNAAAAGFDVKVGSEVEFYFFDGVAVDKINPERGPSVMLDTREAKWNPSPLVNWDKASLISAPFDTYHILRSEILNVMNDNFHVSVESHGHGDGPTGQQHVSLPPFSLLDSADYLLTFKNAVKNISIMSNVFATFMPLPVFREAGSSLRVNISLWEGEKNVFYDAKNEYANLSSAGRYFIGGILEHASALCVFTNPSTNSYKRLAASPKYIMWSAKNKDAVAYVPVRHGEAEDRKRITLTFPDPLANPYLAYAAIVAAGLDGIKKKIDPGDPVDADVSTMLSKERRKLGVKELPSNLMEAIAFLEADNEFLKGTFSSDIIADYLENKIKEHRENELRPTSYEFQKYFNL